MLGTVGAAKGHEHDLRNTFIQSLGNKDEDSIELTQRLERNLVLLLSGFLFYCTALRCFIPVRAFVADVSMDTPEKDKVAGQCGSSF